MEDDEDLEMLRLAALKSLKKENVPAVKPVSKIDVNHVIPVVSNIRPVVEKFYTPGSESEIVQPNIIHHPVPPYVNTGFEKMDINETYVPQRLNPPPLPPPVVVPFNEYNPYVIAPSGANADSTTNVQLSPRSAAFVYENKQIIKRRRNISPAHSPVPFRQSPGRWSRSPSQESWKYHRSNSRSPTYPNHSPHYRNRTISRSPQRRRHSPQPTHSRRNRSRSPIPRNNFDGNAHRSERRSPVPNTRRGNNSSPNRHVSRQWTRENGVHGRKSGSPRIDDTNHRRRRTRSPITNKNTNLNIKRRTASRSPNRKNPRINSNRPRRTPPKRFNNTNGRSGNGNTRNRNHNRQTGSPLLNQHKPHSPQNHHKRKSPIRNNMENGEIANRHSEKEPTLVRHDESVEESTVTKMEEIKPSENLSQEKTEQELEDQLLASSESENSDNESDGIDLFASEESESENEGRFKLSSSKSERKPNGPTVSFSELGKTTTAPADVLLRDLDEMKTDTLNSNRRGGVGVGRRENNRNRRDDRRFNRDRDRDRENRDRNRDRDRERDRVRNRSRGRESESNKNRTDSTQAKNDKKSTVYKSSVTGVDSETRIKTPDGGKIQYINFENLN